MSKANKSLTILFLFFLFLGGCSKDSIEPNEEVFLNSFQKEALSYFKEIALGFEFGSASQITRKWETNLKIYVSGNRTIYQTELNELLNEINELALDGFQVLLVQDSLEANFNLFFSSGEVYAKQYPVAANLVSQNDGLFFLNWDSRNNFTRGHMYVNIEKNNRAAHLHLLREELTQSLGLAKDSPLYPDSIFQSSWTLTQTYSTLDKEIIRLLYHPKMVSGLNWFDAQNRIKQIYSSE